MVNLPRRRILLLFLLTCALPLAGWFAVDALLARRTSALPKPSDLETPSVRARSGMVLARLPDQPLPKSGSTASSPSAASGTVAGRARCGEDQRPVYEEPQRDPEDSSIHLEFPTPDPDGVLRHLPGEIKPAGVGYTGAMRRLDAALRNSGNPFDLAVADWLDLGQVAPPASRTAALVQDALAVDDPRVYGLAYGNCHPWFRAATNGTTSSPPDNCTRLSATRWAQLDPGNAAPWIWELNDADRRGDTLAERGAMQHIAEASRVEIRTYAGAAAVARVQVADADLAAQTLALIQGLAMPLPPVSPLTKQCQDRAPDDRELASICLRIDELLYEHSDSFLWRAIGGSIHKTMTGDASWLDRAHREQQLTIPMVSSLFGLASSAVRRSCWSW